MASEDLRDGNANYDSRGENAAVTPAAIPADYDAALSQLNMLDTPIGVIGQDGQKKSEHSYEEGAICKVSAAATDRDSAISSPTELCSLGDAKAQEFDASVHVHDRKTNLDAAGETTKTDAVGSVFAAGDPAFAPLCALNASREEKGVDVASDDVRDEKTIFDPRIEKEEIIAATAAPTDYHSELLQIIESAENDPRELRDLVYELARTSLAREIDGGRSAPEDLKDLESAIARVEVDFLCRDSSDTRRIRVDTGPELLDGGLALEKIIDATSAVVTSNENIVAEESSFAGLARRPIWPANPQVLGSEGSGSRNVALSGARAERTPFEIVYSERDKTDAVRVRRRIWLWFILWPAIQLIGVVVFCLIIYLALARRLDMQGLQIRQPIVVEAQRPLSVEPLRSSGLPLPATYGVYAISEEHLSELQPLPIRAQDPRVQLSAEIDKPSSTKLPDGKIVFILFRRELLNSAPQNVAIRVVARVASTLTFSSGKAAVLKPDTSWHIRGNSYEFQVSPLNENREMVVARPMDPDFALPSGRYALVFGGLAYDFTVAGRVTDPAQCLESFEAVNGPVFTECRPK
jgi:hypothetical protein